MEEELQNLQVQLTSLQQQLISQTGSQADFKPGISHVTVKIPPFWPADPEMWFVHVEAQFDIARITNALTQDSHLIAAMDPSTLSQISDIIKNPDTRTYEAVKSAVIKRFSVSSEDKLRKLLGNIELGDKKPSRLLLEIRSLAGTTSDDIIKVLWLQRLPSNTQSILQVCQNKNLDDLAEMASVKSLIHLMLAKLVRHLHFQ